MSNLEAFEANMGSNAPFKRALQEYNKNKDKFCIPRKGTNEYKAVMKLMKDKYMNDNNNNNQPKKRSNKQKSNKQQSNKPRTKLSSAKPSPSGNAFFGSVLLTYQVP